MLSKRLETAAAFDAEGIKVRISETKARLADMAPDWDLFQSAILVMVRILSRYCGVEKYDEEMRSVSGKPPSLVPYRTRTKPEKNVE